MTAAEKKAKAERVAALKKRERESAAETRRLQEEQREAERREREDRRKGWEAQFKSKIINPSEKNKDPNGNKKKGFTVWCSDGYDYDGWHSYEGPPDKLFDTTYKTKSDANERARYLFYAKNPWGHPPHDIMEREEVHESSKDGLVTYRVSPVDSSTWTVSIVPDAAFAYMENAKQDRHWHDNDEPIDDDFDDGVAF